MIIRTIEPRSFETCPIGELGIKFRVQIGLLEFKLEEP